MISIARIVILPEGIGDVDFVQYWSSARALLNGQNPYHPAVLEDIQRKVVPKLAEVTRMWNPPAMLAVAIPISLFPFEWARSLWWLTQIVFIVCAFFLSSELLGLTRIERRWGTAILLSSASLYNSVGIGQLPPVLLLGWIGFLTLMRSRPLAGGLVLSLTLLKPHLLFLNYLIVASSRFWGALVGMVAGLVILTIIPALIQPEIFKWYLEAAQEPPIYWFNASLGAWSQFAAVEAGLASSTVEKLIFRFLPALLSGIAILSLRPPLRRATPVNLVILAPWSLALSPYGWIYDQLLLLPTMLLIMRDSLRTGRYLSLVLLLGSGLLQLLTPAWFGQSASAWYPLFLGFLALQCRQS